MVLLLVQLAFSAYAVLGSAAFRSGTSPTVFALLRDLIAVGCFLPTLYFESRAQASPRLLPRAEHLGQLLLLGILGVWGSQLMSALSIANLSAPIYGLLKPCAPVVSLVVAVAVGLQQFNIRTRASQLLVAGVLLSVGGAAYIVGASYQDRESANAPLGAFYVSLYLLFAGCYPILQKRVLTQLDYSPLFLTTWAYCLGTALIASSVIVAAPPAAAWSFTGVGAAGLVFSGIVTSYVNYALMAWANKKTSGVFVSCFYPLQSFFTPALAAVFLGADIMPSDVAGGVVVCLGLACCIGAQVLGGEGTVGAQLGEEGKGALPLLREEEVEQEIVGEEAAAQKRHSVPPHAGFF